MGQETRLKDPAEPEEKEKDHLTEEKLPSLLDNDHARQAHLQTVTHSPSPNRCQMG